MGHLTFFNKIIFYFKEKFCIFAELVRCEISSVGLEHLPYKQRVGGPNPSFRTSVKFV